MSDKLIRPIVIPLYSFFLVALAILTPFAHCLRVLFLLPLLIALPLHQLLPSHHFTHYSRLLALAVILATTSLLLARQDNATHLAFHDWLGDERTEAELTFTILDGPVISHQGYSYDIALHHLDIAPFDQPFSHPPTLRLFFSTKDLDPCLPLPLPGDRLNAWGRLERFTPRETPFRSSQREVMESRGYLARVHIQEAPLSLHNSPSLPTRLRRTLAYQRFRLERRIATHLRGDALAIALAMLTGSKGLLRPEFRTPFDLTSTGHILAISGLHFGVIAALIGFFLRLIFDRFPKIYCQIPRRRLLGLTALLFLFLYLLAIGAPISACRAFGMLAIAILVYSFLPFRTAPLEVLATIAGLLLFLHPHYLLELGYQLSVTATGGICLFLKVCPTALKAPTGPLIAETRLQIWRRKLLLFLGVSLSADIATWPIIWAHTGEIPLISLIANQIVIPLVGTLIFPVLVAGALLTSLEFFHPLASFCLQLSTESLILMGQILDRSAYLPVASLRPGTPSPEELLILAIAVLLAILTGLRPRILIRLIPIALAMILLCRSFPQPPPMVELHFIPVGQGDATLIRLPDNRSFLIDAGGRSFGPDPGLMQVAPYLRHLGIRRLDGLIITHADIDHYGGIEALLRPFRPRTVYFDPDEHDPHYQSLLRQSRLLGANLHPVNAHVPLSTQPVQLHILRPPLPEASHNDRSLVVTLHYQGAGVLLSGDLEADGEAWLRNILPVPHTIFKAGHHGSRTSSNPATITHFQPRIAIISSGRHNHFGHPHPEVLQRFQATHTDVIRLDQQGATRIQITPDGAIRVRTLRPYPRSPFSPP